ncbi:MAG: oxygen-independent coproporphyrinogen III oxidase [Clostridia bacterium]|nr:oxygen-independent coproporphyrinogen III oxidase [Clostridia bacterium]
MKEIGIYIHIPYCKRKCNYCDFISFSDKDNTIKEYIETIKKEIDECKLSGFDIGTIYIGGGTPSYIDSKYIIEIIAKIREKFIVTQNAEITIELNPGTITREKLQDYKQAGINRLSIGLQSTDNNILKKIGRIHTYEEFVENYNLAREIGFKNINIDFMLALPEENEWSVAIQISEIINLKPEHISCYSLIVEEETKLKEMLNNKEITLPSEEEERKMYWKTKELLEENGYNHYEISNFALPGYNSRHNTDCWNQKEYLGFGTAAHSYYGGKRFSNAKTIEEYIQNYNEKTLEEEQSKESMAKEYMMLGLRKVEGISISEFERKFQINPLFYFRFEISKLVDEELIEIDLDNIRLTSKGLDLANLVFEEFI